MPGGRPTVYKQEYCQMLIDHMASGLSFLSFAAVINVSEECLYEWGRVHQEFSEAKKEAFVKNRLFWEDLAIKNIKADKFQSTVWIFNMKNRFPKEWRDRQEVEQTSLNVNTTPATKEELIEAIKMARDEKFKG